MYVVVLFNEMRNKLQHSLIRELNNRLAQSNAALFAAQQAARSAQALHAGTMQQQLTDGEQPVEEEIVKKKGSLDFWKIIIKIKFGGVLK